MRSFSCILRRTWTNVLWGVINGGVVAVVLKDFLSWKQLVLEGDPGAW